MAKQSYRFTKISSKKKKRKIILDRRELIRLPQHSAKQRLSFLLGKFLHLALAMLLLFHIAVLAGASTCSLMYSFLNPPVTSFLLYRMTNNWYLPRKAEYIPLCKIPDHVQSMFIRLEDANFYKHNGIDIEAMQYAYSVNKKYGQIVLGGSTITQQLARTLFLVPNKNYLRKYTEVLIALTMDFILSKQRILELYLNSIEWGEGVYGIGAAAWYHFNKPFIKLDYDHICRLAAIIVNPLRYNVKNMWSNPVVRFRYAIIYNRY
ncbi:MAG: monofunctional biosynthetic peptidoglycan transglycosylase [Spirochaetales bacterium]|nr:monofunctional biosynthetic peptidoglycan transglycosylase [Spirochaetales bacterium]